MAEERNERGKATAAFGDSDQARLAPCCRLPKAARSAPGEGQSVANCSDGSGCIERADARNIC